MANADLEKYYKALDRYDPNSVKLKISQKFEASNQANDSLCISIEIQYNMLFGWS